MDSFDFDTIIDRSKTDAVKWRGLKDLHSSKWSDIIPMWVADMDFACPPCVTEAIKKRAEHPIFGYASRPDQLFEAYIGWMKRRHNIEIKAEWLLFSPGIVSAMGTAIRAYTQIGTGVVNLTPVYAPFRFMTENNGRRVIDCPLVLNNERYEIDFEAFDKACSQAQLVIFSNPHNPLGRVWTKEELCKVAEIVKKHKVILFSDEIHADLVYKTSKMTSALDLDKELEPYLVAAWAPSKTFNIAGLQASVIVIPDKTLRHKFEIECSACASDQINCMSQDAAAAAFNYGEEWLDACLEHMYGNYELLCKGLENTKLKVMPLEGTYLAWVDFRAAGLQGNIKNEVIEQAGVWLDEGTKFGQAGSGFGRINLGCPRPVMVEAVNRLASTFA